MAVATTSTSLFHSILNSPSIESFSVTFSLPYPRVHFHGGDFSVSKRVLLRTKCSGNSPQERGRGESLKDALSGIVGEQVDELLSKDENRVLLDGLEKASHRVEMAKRDLAEIERQELEAKELKNYIDQLESRASEIAECQREISEARAMVEKAERCLNEDRDGDGDAIENEEERLESIKAALISAIVGTIAALPISSTQVSNSTQLILPSVTTFISCALFGVTFRYAVRRDLDNFQLKTGTSAAFGFVKGLGALARGPPLELNAGSFLFHAFDGAVYVAQNFLIFVFAAISLDFCFKMRLLSPFPLKRSKSSVE